VKDGMTAVTGYDTTTIWERRPVGDPDGPVGLRAQVVVGEVSIGRERWRAEEIVEDPVNSRGHVTLTRVA
jgi:hypothetical protein